MIGAVDELRETAREYAAVCERVESIGSRQLQAVSRAYHDTIELFDRYEARATDWDDFEGYLEFQEQLVALLDDIPEDLPERAAFDAADEQLHQQNLSTTEFERARSALEPAAEHAELLDRHQLLRDRYHDARHAVRHERAAVTDRIERLERLKRFETVDLDAPVDRIRVPIEAYNDAINEAFSAFIHEASARTVVSFLETTAQYPLINYRQPPAGFREYVMSKQVGTETIPTLLEYAGYSRSKLGHYVDDPQALLGAVNTNRTYLGRLDGKPLEIAWPPPAGSTLYYQLRERIAVAGRFAPEETIVQLRTLRALSREPEYKRLRESAIAREQLDTDARERLQNGAVDRELEAEREKHEQLGVALEEHRIEE